MKNKNKKLVIVLLLIISLLLITVGVSVAFFSYVKKGTTENRVKLGDITFRYTENTQLGNGITIMDAFPMSDEEGKQLEEEGQIFDFKVEANLSRSDLEYEIVADVMEGSTLPLDAIKFYLADITNEKEKDIVTTLRPDGVVKTLDDFSETEIQGATGKTIYQETILKNTKGYYKQFRARMWINEEIDWSDNQYMNTSGSVRINVYANSDRSMASTDTTNPDDIRIERVVANRKYLFNRVTGEQYQYTVTLPNEVDIVNIDVIPTNTEATVEVTPINEKFGLVVGENYFSAKVISGNKEKSKDYILRVVREQSKSTDLENLEIVGYSLHPVYSNGENHYEVEVPYEVNSLEVRITKKEEVQRVEGSGTYELEVGSNIIPIKVIAEDGTIREIVITVNRLLSDDAGIENVGVTGYSLNHVESNIYSATVDYEIESVEITNISKTGASVSETGIKQPLEIGNNDYEVKVTSASGKNENSYIIRIIRKKDTDNTLKSLALTDCTLTPTFASGTTSYQCTVENNITKTIVSASTTSKEAKVSGTGEKNLIVGNNSINVVVTAQNGENKTYEIVVTRKASNDATLKAITVSNGVLSPTFSASITDYTVSVDYNVTSITVNGTKNHEKASVSGTGNKILNVGKNTVEIIVTAEDGTTQTYTIRITREQDTDNTLKSLSLTNCTLTPTFNSGTTSYQCTVANSITQTTVGASATSKEAQISGTGQKNLNVGDNTINVVVTAQDGSTNTYTVVVHRNSNDATLKALSVTGWTISPTFASETTSYTLTVPNATSSITVNATKNHSKASISGTGNKTLAEGNNAIKVVVTAEDGNTKEYTITVKRMKQDTITLNAKNTTYTGSVISANTASATSGSSITYTYYSTTDCSGTALSGAPTNVGNYSVKVISAGNSDYESANKCVAHTITKGTPTISLAAKSVEATGSAITTNTATAKNPNGSAVSLSYTYTYYSSTNCSGTALSSAPSTVGNYSVKATSTATTNLNSGSTCVLHTITKNTNANLSSLSVSGYSISPTFNAGTQNYTVTVEATSVTVNATKASSLATVTGTGSKTLNWGTNELNVIVTAQDGTVKIYKITVTNQRPTAPTTTGGSSSWVATAPTISVTKAGSAISGVKHYEYYKSTSNTAPSDSTSATGTTSGSLTISDEGTTYIWYRTVSNNGNKSVWTGPQVTNLDTITPVLALESTKYCSGAKVTSGTTSDDLLEYTLKQTNTSISGSTILYCIDTTNTCTPNIEYKEKVYARNNGRYYFRYRITSGAGKSFSSTYTAVVNDTTYCAVNLIKNGSFEDGIDDWGNYSPNNLSVTNHEFGTFAPYGSKVLRIRNLIDIQTWLRISTNANNLANHKLYAKVSAYRGSTRVVPGIIVESSFSSDMWESTMFRDGTNYEIESPNTYGKWLNLSIYMVSPYNYLKIMLTQSLLDGTSEEEFYFDGLIVIDLTDTFGAGNEPDKEWCDKHISFDKIKSISL